MKLLKSRSGRPAKTRRPRPEKPLGAWRLFKASLSELRSGWKIYLLTVLIVTLPVALLSLSPAVANNSAAAAYQYMVILLMNIAVVWVIVRREATGESPRLADAYYKGTAGILSFILTVAVLVTMLIPAIIGTVIYLIGTLAVEGAGTAAEVLLISLVAVIVALPSVWMLVRFGLAPIVTVSQGLRPVAALRYARFLTLGRFWRIFSRYVLLFIFILILSIPIAGITALIGLLKLGWLAGLFFGLASTIIAVPFANIYMFKLMRNLEANKATAEELAEAE